MIDVHVIAGSQVVTRDAAPRSADILLDLINQLAEEYNAGKDG